jgi:hypothetical protein
VSRASEHVSNADDCGELSRTTDQPGISPAVYQTNSRSFQMMQSLLYEVLSRERTRVDDEQVRRAYLRQLAVLRRRQRKADAARRALQSLSV